MKPEEIVTTAMLEADTLLSFLDADRLATAALRALSEQGYAVVPVEPTREMLHAAAKAMSPGNKPDKWVSNSVKHGIRWRAMLDAAGRDESA